MLCRTTRPHQHNLPFGDEELISCVPSPTGPRFESTLQFIDLAQSWSGVLVLRAFIQIWWPWQLAFVPTSSCTSTPGDYGQLTVPDLLDAFEEMAREFSQVARTISDRQVVHHDASFLQQVGFELATLAPSDYAGYGALHNWARTAQCSNRHHLSLAQPTPPQQCGHLRVACVDPGLLLSWYGSRCVTCSCDLGIWSLQKFPEQPKQWVSPGLLSMCFFSTVCIPSCFLCLSQLFVAVYSVSYAEHFLTMPHCTCKWDQFLCMMLLTWIPCFLSQKK